MVRGASPLIVCSLGTDRLAVAAAKLAARPFTIAEPVQGFLAGLTLWVAGTAPVVEGYEDGATLAILEWDLV